MTQLILASFPVKSQTQHSSPAVRLKMSIDESHGILQLWINYILFFSWKGANLGYKKHVHMDSFFLRESCDYL